MKTAAGDRTVEPSGLARQVSRGVRRRLADLGQATIVELGLACGRRADIVAVDAKGGIAIIEVKSSVADFQADRKWRDYRLWCDRFFFAVPAAFPLHRLPPDCGLLVADAYDAEFLRQAPTHPLPAARRKAVLLRFAATAAGRLHRLEDPHQSDPSVSA